MDAIVAFIFIVKTNSIDRRYIQLGYNLKGYPSSHEDKFNVSIVV